MDKAAQGGDAPAVTDGRRIYLGNLLYSVTPEEVDAVLQEHGLGKYDKIHLSFDPVSGRNPGYCFVEFFHRDDAEIALNALAATEIGGRPVKVGPCHAKSSAPRQGGREPRPRTDAPPTERWGDWRGSGQGRSAAGAGNDEAQAAQSPHRAMQHHREMASNEGDGRRLYVGGLAQMVNQEQHQEELQKYFAGFNAKAIGKRITPHESTRALPGNHHYCFVDFATAEDAQAAMAKLNGMVIPSGALKISVARTPRARTVDTDSPRRSGSEEDQQPRRPKQETPQRSLMSNNWRSKGQ